MISREQILDGLKRTLRTKFDVDEKIIQLDARLYEDLDIDSIDAVDLIIEIKELTGIKLEPDIYRNIRTVGDIVDALYNLAKT